MKKTILADLETPHSTINAKSCYTQDTLSPRQTFGPKSKAKFIFPKNFDPLPLDQSILCTYNIWSDIGKGTFATVRFGTHKTSGFPVAIKIYENSKLRVQIRQQSVKNEIKILKKLNHPNIVSLYEDVQGAQNQYLVMEYIKGASLLALVSKPSWKKLDETRCALIFSEIIAGLAYCHSKNVAHRDIKLENIMLDSTGQAKIIDFGFATMSSQMNKKTFLYCGTPNYMAPEIVRRERYPGESADVWAAGVLLFMMLTGKFPFGSSKEQQVFEKIIKNQVEYPEGISVECRDLLKGMLEPCWKKRVTSEMVLKHGWVKNKGKAVTKNLPHKGDVDEIYCE